MDLPERIAEIGSVIIDGYFVLDSERRILDFNQTFFSMLPRFTSRGLKGKKCYDVMRLEICKERCIAQKCWSQRKHIRLDEITGQPAGMDRKLTFILSALPFFNPDGSPCGALVVQRNVTDEAQVQSKYQEMLEQDKRERARLMELVRCRTKDLLQTSDQLLKVQKELMEFRRGRLV